MQCTRIAVDNSGCTRATEYVQMHCDACVFLTWDFEHRLPNTLPKHKGKREIKERKKNPELLNSLVVQSLLDILGKNAY